MLISVNPWCNISIWEFWDFLHPICPLVIHSGHHWNILLSHLLTLFRFYCSCCCFYTNPKAICTSSGFFVTPRNRNPDPYLLNAKNFHSQLCWTQNSINTLAWQWTTERRTTTKSIFITCKKKLLATVFMHRLFSVILQGLNHVLKFTSSLWSPKRFPLQNKWMSNHLACNLIQFTETWTTHSFNICKLFGNNEKSLYALAQTLNFLLWRKMRRNIWYLQC